LGGKTFFSLVGTAFLAGTQAGVVETVVEASGLGEEIVPAADDSRRSPVRGAVGHPARVVGGPGTGKTVVALHRALHLARRLPADAPDGSDGGDESLTGYRSTLHGERPQVHGTNSKAEEIAGLVKQVTEWSRAGVATREIGVAVRFVQLGRDIAQALARAGIPSVVLGTPTGTVDGRRSTVCTLARCTE
jgi:hypothetical protein